MPSFHPESGKLSQSATALVLVSIMGFTLAGCGIGAPVPASTQAIVAPAMKGQVYGGPNPIIGATVKLYTTGYDTSGIATYPTAATGPGYGVATLRQEANSVDNGANYPSGDTDLNGNFNFAGGYNCPAGQFAYIVSAGGNTGSSTTSTPATLGTVTVNGSGAITSIAITNGGTNYDSATVTITDSTATITTPAVITPIVTNGVITGFIYSGNGNTGGAGYDSNATAAISNPTYTNGANAQAVLVSALGRCEDLFTSIGSGEYSGYTAANPYINELTTVAAAYALGHFSTVSGSGASTIVSIGADATNNAAQVSGVSTGCVYGDGVDGNAGLTCAATATAGLAHAFQNASNLVNVFSPATVTAGANINLPNNANSLVPQQLIDTIANVLVACTNSVGGVAGDNSACGKIFVYTSLPSQVAAIDTYTTSVPTNTFTAMVNLAANPALGGTGGNLANFYNIQGSFTNVYSPYLTAAPGYDYSIAINYPAANGFVAADTGAIDINDVFYVANINGTTTTYVSFGSNGALLGTSPSFTFKGNSTTALDAIGHGYTAGGSGTSGIAIFAYSGGIVSATPIAESVANTSHTALILPTSMAADQHNNIWAFGAINGTAGTSTLYYSPPGITGTNYKTWLPIAVPGPSCSAPARVIVGLSFDPNQNVWAACNTELSVIGNTAAPGATPTYTAGTAGITATVTTTGANPAEQISFTGTSSVYSAWLAGYNTNPGVVEYTPGFDSNGNGVASLSATPSSGASDPGPSIGGIEGNASDGSGTVWLADTYGGSVDAYFPPESSATVNRLVPCIGVSGGANSTCTSVFVAGKPTTISIDSAGSMWLATASTSVVEVIGAAAPTWPLLSIGKLGQP
jgi:hypothetical protein